MWHYPHSPADVMHTGQQPIDISCVPRPQQQTCSSGYAAVGPCWNRQTDRQMDGHCTLHRSCSAYYVGSAKRPKIKIEVDGKPVRERFHLGMHVNMHAHAQTDELPKNILPQSHLKDKRRHKHNSTTNWEVPSVHWRCRLGCRKGIRPVKNWVVGCWHGYLPGARCRLAYGPDDASATHCLLLQ